MTQDEKNKQKEHDIMEEVEEELSQIEDEEGKIDEEQISTAQGKTGVEEDQYKQTLTRTLADFENFKKRTQRDQQDMIFFQKQNILTKILPRIDDLERIIKNTPEDIQKTTLFEGISSLYTKILQDFGNLGVKPFESIGQKIDPNKHDVMTTIAGKEEGIIVDEFEKGYLLGEKVLRHAKVVAGSGE